MQRGRHYYGCGFWKRNKDWVPGNGGFRGVACSYTPESFPYQWWGYCKRFATGSVPYPYWKMEIQNQDEAGFLKEQAESLRSELDVIEKRLAGLTQEQSNGQEQSC